MLQALLEDRFQLKTHREIEEVPMYALNVAKSGLKMNPREDGGCTPRDPVKRRTLAPGEKPWCVTRSGSHGPNRTIDAAGQDLGHLVSALSQAVDRHVIDQTGTTSLFSFHLEFAHDENAVSTADIPPGPSVFTALEQLGLKLEPIKGPHGFIVIDHVERSSEN